MKSLWAVTAICVLVVILLTAGVVYEIWPRTIPAPAIPADQPITLEIRELDLSMGMPNLVVILRNETDRRLRVSPSAMERLLDSLSLYDESGREWIWTGSPHLEFQSNVWGGGGFSGRGGSFALEPESFIEEVVMIGSDASLQRTGLIASLMREPSRLVFVIDQDYPDDLVRVSYSDDEDSVTEPGRFVAHGKMKVIWSR